MFKQIITLLITWLVLCNLLQAQPADGRRYQPVLSMDVDSIKCRELIKHASLLADSLQQYNKALLIYEKVNAILKTKNYSYLDVKLYYNWGYAYYLKGDYKEADRLYVKALSYKLLDEQPEFKAKILNNAGANLFNMKVYKRAMSFYNEALEIYIHSRNFKGIRSIYWNMANVNSAIGNVKKAEEFFNKALKIPLENSSANDNSQILGSKAYLKEGAGEYDSAIIFLNRIFKLPLKEQMKTPFLYTSFYLRLGRNYAELEKWDSCFYSLDRGKHLCDSMGLSEQLEARFYNTMGYCYDLKEDFNKAIYYYKKVLKIKTGIGNFRFVYENIADIYFNSKQYDSAFYYKEKAIRFADSLYKSELKEHITFEDTRIELLEKNYKDNLKAMSQENSLRQLEKRNYILVSVIALLALSVLIFFLYFRQFRLKVKKEQLQSEIDFLRGQLNPHFLFNSINNIYVLIDENKTYALEILMKFSALLRYQLYECNVSAISLNKEQQFLENYIAFEKLRYSNKIEINYRTVAPGAGSVMIAPLLLQPFVENAFKHSPKKKEPLSFITINLSLDGKDLLFQVSNTLNKQKNSELPGGIGLENVKKRLKLLYPGKHHLEIIKTEEVYSVTLKLRLSHD